MSATEEITKLVKSIKQIEIRLTKVEKTLAKLESMSEVGQSEIIGRDYTKFKKSTQWQPDQEQTKQNKANK